eukprot:1712444-Alexandrium_andersonii.AAC.1
MELSTGAPRSLERSSHAGLLRGATHGKPAELECGAHVEQKELIQRKQAAERGSGRAQVEPVESSCGAPMSPGALMWSSERGSWIPLRSS